MYNIQKNIAITLPTTNINHLIRLNLYLKAVYTMAKIAPQKPRLSLLMNGEIHVYFGNHPDGSLSANKRTISDKIIYTISNIG